MPETFSKGALHVGVSNGGCPTGQLLYEATAKIASDAGQAPWHLLDGETKARWEQIAREWPVARELASKQGK